MTYDRLLGMQLTAGALAMVTLGRQMKQPKPSDPAWVASVNKLAEQVAALARIALDARPPAEYARVHRMWRDAILNWHKAVTTALETFTSDVATATTNHAAWRRAAKLATRGWHEHAKAQKELRRIRMVRVAVHHVNLKTAEIDVVA